MTQVSIAAEARSDFGKGASRRLRRAGRIPAVIYGDGNAIVHVSLPGHDLELALRKPRVVLEVAGPQGTTLVKPRDVPRDPVKRTLEHVDLVIITKAEAQERSDMADAIHAAEVAAVAAGIDPAAAAQAVEDAVARGENAADAAAHAVHDVEEQAEAYSDANRAEEAAEAAGAATEATPEG